MKKWILVGCLMVNSAFALEWSTCIAYYTKDDATAKPPVLQDDGQGVYIRQWNSRLPVPTKAQLEALEETAIAWKAAKDKDELADLEKAEEKVKLFLRALVICINKRLPAGNKITETELKQEARALLDAQ